MDYVLVTSCYYTFAFKRCSDDLGWLFVSLHCQGFHLIRGGEWCSLECWGTQRNLLWMARNRWLWSCWGGKPLKQGRTNLKELFVELCNLKQQFHTISYNSSIEIASIKTPEACNGVFRFDGLHQQKPLFKADSGAIIYFNRQRLSYIFHSACGVHMRSYAFIRSQHV